MRKQVISPYTQYLVFIYGGVCLLFQTHHLSKSNENYAEWQLSRKDIVAPTYYTTNHLTAFILTSTD